MNNLEKRRYDIGIIGGGASGLSLAAELGKLSVPPSICVLEARKKYTNDRTWCFFGEKNPPESVPVSNSWSEWLVSTNFDQVVHHANNWAYHFVKSSDFYQLRVSQLNLTPRCSLLFDTQVKDVLATQTGFNVTTLSGNNVSASHVIDCRPPPDSILKQSKMFQIFIGAEIQLQDGQSTYTRPHLMERLTDTRFGLLFLYLIPVDNNRLLVELTAFSKQQYSPEVLKPFLMKIINYRFHVIREAIIRTEQGVLPMGLPTQREARKNGIIKGGVAAGALRASTGYGFSRIQKWAKDCALHYEKYGQIPDLHCSTKIERAMDSLFLDVLASGKVSASSLLFNMTKQTNGATFARFMSDNATLLDLFKVINAMPKLLFLRALIAKLLMSRYWREQDEAVARKQ
ncbi:lycopene cyclase family protein [Veronia nyctiphanis]|uniref:lycopene cyclase family protein n=1 Tax=Veronia nyctiphanis TaxID=1278244 RepID=UPI001375B56D|nr:lycopene cyclase family protein [Veronia nyctiphanis]